MKKLLTMIGVAATALGLFADGSFVYNKTDFKLTPLGLLDVEKNDEGGDTGPFYWDGDAGDSEIKPVSEAEDADRFLDIANASPLYRRVKDKGQGAQAIDTGVFADMLVKFTASEAGDEVTLDDGAKLGLWVVDAGGGNTNLMVKAASLVAGATAPVATNFVLAVKEGFDFAATHRVTIRAINEISSGNLGMAGFVIFIDEEAVVAADADYADKIGFTDFNSVAKPFYDDKKLFVSLVEAGTLAAQTIEGVGFKGNGELAYVALTDAKNAPDFALPAVNVEIAWDKGVTSFTYQIGDAAEVTVDNLTSAGTQTIQLPTVATLVKISDTVAEGYIDLGITGEKITKTDDGWQFQEEGATLKLKAAEVAFTVNGEPFATFEEALAAADGKTIKLAKDFIIGGAAYINIGDEEGVAPISTTIDLAGKTIDVANGQPCGFYVGLKSTLAVIDTIGGGTLAASNVTEDFTGVFYVDGECMIGNEDDDQGVTADALVGTGSGLTILKGLFLKSANDKNDLANFIDGEEYEIVDAGDYWKVQKAAPAPTGTVLLITAAGTETNVYETLDAAFAAAPATAKIELTADLSGAGIALFAADQKDITLDLGGFTYTCVEPPVGSSGTQNQAFHFEQGNTVVIKNGTLTTVQGSTAFRFVIQNYADLTLDGVTVDGSKLAITGRARYTLSNNCGTVALGNGTALIASTVADGQDAFAMDTCKYASYALPTVTINGVTITGDIELGGGNLTLTAGTLTGALVDGGIGAGVITKSDDFDAEAPAGYIWKNGTLVKTQVPTATVIEIGKVEDYEAAVKFTAVNQGVGYDDWTAKFILTSDVAIGADEIKLGGSYAASEGGKWQDIDFPGCAAGEEVVIAEELEITVEDLFKFVNEFSCGVKNIALKNDATFSIKLVISKDSESETLCEKTGLKVQKKAEDWHVPAGDEDKPASEVFGPLPQELTTVPAGTLSVWAKQNKIEQGSPFTADMIDAYVLNCAPTAEAIADEKAKINIASIEYKNGEWVVKTVSGDEKGDEFANGTLVLRDVTKTITGVDGSDSEKLWRMELVPTQAAPKGE